MLTPGRAEILTRFNIHMVLVLPFNPRVQESRGPMSLIFLISGDRGWRPRLFALTRGLTQTLRVFPSEEGPGFNVLWILQPFFSPPPSLMFMIIRRSAFFCCRSFSLFHLPGYPFGPFCFLHSIGSLDVLVSSRSCGSVGAPATPALCIY